MDRPGQLIDRMTIPLQWVATFTIAAMMIFTAVDVFGRYFLNRPIPGSYEITSIMMVVSIFFCLAYTQVSKGHVNIDLVANLFPEKARAVVDTTTYILAAGTFAIITWQSVLQAIVMRNRGEATEVLGIPHWPFLLVVGVGTGIFTLVIFKDICQLVFKVIKGRWQHWLGLLFGLSLAILLCSTAIWGKQWGLQMEPLMTGVCGIAIVFMLMVLGLPVAFALAFVGLLGVIYIIGPISGIGLLKTVPYTHGGNYVMSTVPLFILMGMFTFHAGLGEDLYWAAYKWFGRLPGGLAIATVAGCAGLAAVTSSAMTGVVIMGAVALPEMRKYGYKDKLALGSIVSGSTLGSLIPPSIMLIIYAVLTEESIGGLFMGAFIPGILEAAFYMIAIYISCKINPNLGPRGPKVPFKEKKAALGNTWQTIALFLIIMGGIYGGIFTPIEAGGIGALAALAIALLKKRMTWDKFFNASLMETGRLAAMTLIILITASIFGYFMSLSRLPFELATWVGGLQLPPWAIMGCLIGIYIILGCFMSSIALIIVTVPIFFPVAVDLGFHPIWFGIIIVRMMEIAAITPPYGLNLFVVKGVVKDTNMITVYKGVFPFIIADIIHVSLLLMFPQIVLFLPNTMFGM